MNTKYHTQGLARISFHLSLFLEPSLYLGEGIDHIILKGGNKK